MPFGAHVVPAGSRMREAVSILGSTEVAGTVVSDAVSILGETVIREGGKVGGAAVAVLGRLESHGEIGDEAVSVLGGVLINGPVGDEVVSVLGDLELGPKAVIGGDVVLVGGRLTRHPDAIVRGNEVHVPAFGGLGNFEWLTTWISRCVVYGRLLAFGDNLEWAWIVAFSFLGFYLFLALLFPRGVARCAETLETRPGYSILTSVLTVMLTPVVIVLLAVTVVGALLIPFLGVALFSATLFGKAVMLAWIGRRFTPLFGDSRFGHPAVAVLIGGLIMLLLYSVPIVGMLSYKLFSWLGLGVVVYAIGLAIKREKRPPLRQVAGPVSGPTAPLPSPVAPTAAAPMAGGAPGVETPAPPMTSAGFSAADVGAAEAPRSPEAGVPPPPPAMGDAGAFTPPPVPPIASAPPVATAGFGASAPAAAVAAPVVSPAVAWPRAGFFIRLGALAIDAVLIALIMAFLDGMLPGMLELRPGPGGWLLALAIYGAVMWKLRGTTIGGIVCGLKVVRLDNREIDWPTGVVRALACFLSLAVVGLGFIWIAIDDENQSWHDKIAGTAVVLAPRGVSLV